MQLIGQAPISMRESIVTFEAGPTHAQFENVALSALTVVQPAKHGFWYVMPSDTSHTG